MHTRRRAPRGAACTSEGKDERIILGKQRGTKDSNWKVENRRQGKNLSTKSTYSRRKVHKIITERDSGFTYRRAVALRGSGIGWQLADIGLPWGPTEGDNKESEICMARRRERDGRTARLLQWCEALSRSMTEVKLFLSPLFTPRRRMMGTSNCTKIGSYEKKMNMNIMVGGWR